MTKSEENQALTSSASLADEMRMTREGASSASSATPIGLRMRKRTPENGPKTALTMSLDLPWPGSDLNPNKRHQWSALAKAKKAYRARCAAIARQAGVGCLPPGLTRLTACLTFCPPDRRPRDLDNMLASMKAGLDGLSDAIGIDDRHWKLTLDVGAPVTGGMVLVNLEIT